MNCPSPSFDFSATAALVSQLAGVLAGFAFVSVMLVLQGQHRRPSQGGAQAAEANARQAEIDRKVLACLTASFLCLVLVTFQYAVIGGERGCALVHGRASSEELLGGIGFVLSFALLLSAMVQLVSHGGVGQGTTEGLRVDSIFRLIVISLVPGVGSLFLVIAVQDLASALGTIDVDGTQHPAQPFFDLAGDLSIPIPTALALLGFLSWLWGRDRRGHSVTGHGGSRWIRAILIAPYGFLALTLAAIVRSATLSSVSASAHISQPEAWTWMALCSAALVAQSVLLALEPGAET